MTRENSSFEPQTANELEEAKMAVLKNIEDGEWRSILFYESTIERAFDELINSIRFKGR